MKQVFCALNISRQCFLNLGVTVADTSMARLRGVLGKVRLRSDEAIWVVPSRGVHTIGVRFSIDVIYLDAQMKVVHLVENLRPFRIAPVRWNCASVLELPKSSICESGTEVGDQLMICSHEEMQRYCESQSGAPRVKSTERTEAAAEPREAIDVSKEFP